MRARKRFNFFFSPGPGRHPAPSPRQANPSRKKKVETRKMPPVLRGKKSGGHSFGNKALPASGWAPACAGSVLSNPSPISRCAGNGIQDKGPKKRKYDRLEGSAEILRHSRGRRRKPRIDIRGKLGDRIGAAEDDDGLKDADKSAEQGYSGLYEERKERDRMQEGAVVTNRGTRYPRQLPDVLVDKDERDLWRPDSDGMNAARTMAETALTSSLRDMPAEHGAGHDRPQA